MVETRSALTSTVLRARQESMEENWSAPKVKNTAQSQSKNRPQKKSTSKESTSEHSVDSTTASTAASTTASISDAQNIPSKENIPSSTTPEGGGLDWFRCCCRAETRAEVVDSSVSVPLLSDEPIFKKQLSPEDAAAVAAAAAKAEKESKQKAALKAKREREAREAKERKRIEDDAAERKRNIARDNARREQEMGEKRKGFMGPLAQPGARIQIQSEKGWTDLSEMAFKSICDQVGGEAPKFVINDVSGMLVVDWPNAENATVTEHKTGKVCPVRVVFA